MWILPAVYLSAGYGYFPYRSSDPLNMWMCTKEGCSLCSYVLLYTCRMHYHRARAANKYYRNLTYMRFLNFYILKYICAWQTSWRDPSLLLKPIKFHAFSFVFLLFPNFFWQCDHRFEFAW